MLEFETRGPAYERGEQQGRICQQLFRRWALRPGTPLAATGELPAARQMFLGRLQRNLEALYPEFLEECEGLARGLEVDRDRYLLTLFDEGLPPPQCTVVGFRDDRGQPMLGKTDDIFSHEIGMNVLETTWPERGHRHVHLHFAGTPWTVAGMNEHGLGIAMTAIPGPTLADGGITPLAALHLILPECADVPETLARLEALPLCQHGFSLLLGDAAGRMALVEKTGAGMVVLPEQADGSLIHTNHILDPVFADRNPPQAEPFHTNGVRRYENAQRLLQSVPRTEAGLARLLADRTPPGPICQRGEDGMHTDFAVMLLPVARRMVVWQGYPDIVPIRTVSMPDLFA